MGVTGSPASATADERHLVERARGGDRAAFRAIVETHQHAVYRVALALTRDHHDAEDVVQEVFVKAYQAIGSFRGEAALGTWLHRMAVNAAITSARRRGARPAEPLLDERGDAPAVRDARAGADPERSAAGRQVRAAVNRALSSLSAAERAVFLLHHHGELSLAEVARATGRADGTVRNLMFRALRKLRRELAPFAAPGKAEAAP
jgi:RNA polymerase sigma-70 factor (ECF subfamily)